MFEEDYYHFFSQLKSSYRRKKFEQHNYKKNKRKK